jgi:hypothetical protein
MDVRAMCCRIGLIWLHHEVGSLTVTSRVCRSIVFGGLSTFSIYGIAGYLFLKKA